MADRNKMQKIIASMLLALVGLTGCIPPSADQSVVTIEPSNETVPAPVIAPGQVLISPSKVPTPSPTITPAPNPIIITGNTTVNVSHVLPGDNIPLGIHDSFSTGASTVDLLVKGDEIWAATSEGVVRYDSEKGTIKKYTVADGLGNNAVLKLALDSKGNIWAACRVSGVSCFNGTNWRNYNVADGLISNDVITLAADKIGGVWVSAYWGVSYFNGSNWTAYTSVKQDAPMAGGGGGNPNNPNTIYVEGVSLDAADVIFIDKAGNVWFSSRVAGVARFDGKSWELFAPGGGVSAVNEDRDGNLWFGTNRGGVSKFDGSKLQNFVISEYQTIIPRPFIGDIEQDKNGNIWVIAYGGGAALYDGRSWQVFTAKDGLTSSNGQSMFFDSEGIPCVITDNGICSFNGTVWRTLTSKDGIPSGQIRTVTKDNFGHIWLGSVEGSVQRMP